MSVNLSSTPCETMNYSLKFQGQGRDRSWSDVLGLTPCSKTDDLSPYLCSRDNFNPKTCHVVPALIKRVLDDENPFIVWGTSDVVRDFLYVKDVVNACLLILEKGEPMRPYNVGSGEAITIGDIVDAVLKATNKSPEVIWDETKPTTIPFRMASTERICSELGFKAEYTFEEGIKETVEWYKNNK